MTVGEKGEVAAVTKKVGGGEKKETGRQKVCDRRGKRKEEIWGWKGKKGSQKILKADEGKGKALGTKCSIHYATQPCV